MLTPNVRFRLRICFDRFSDEDLRTLCFDIGVDYEGLSGQAKEGKARELITYLDNRDRIADLLTYGMECRPDIPWPDILEIAAPTTDRASAVAVEQPRGEGTLVKRRMPRISPAIGQPLRLVTPFASCDNGPVKTNPYHPGSPLPLDSPLYIERKADVQAWDKIQRMEYVLFVEPRQQGKTSLIHHLRVRCAQSYAFAYVDMVNLERTTEDSWYGSLGREILRELPQVVVTQAATVPASSGTWFTFLRELAEAACELGQRLVIVLDEVGAVPDDRATDFFATIRSVFVHRGSIECFRYLTFIISGARDPRDMIRDPRISDFNFERTRIADFTLEQVKGLLLPLNIGTGLDKVANRIYYWTNGQPYLCQRICWFMAEAGGIPSAESVGAAVDDLFLEDGGHLQDIIDELCSAPGLSDSLCRILNRHTRFVPAINRDHFRLAHVIGIVSPNHQPCQVRNNIYGCALLESELCTSLPLSMEELRP
jgi:hypothetical protein